MQSLWRRRLGLLSVLALGAAAPARELGAQTWTLTFGVPNTQLPNNWFLTYGSQPGLVDVRYRHRADWGLSTITHNEAYPWVCCYNDLVDVAYTAQGAGVGEILLDNLAPGQQVTIDAADVGAYSFATETVQLRVYNLLGDLLYQLNGATAGTTTHASFAPGVSDADGLLIQWSQVLPTAANPDAPVDAYNNGIDNVRFTIGPIGSAVVPEPATIVLVAGGLVLTAIGARRRRTA